MIDCPDFTDLAGFAALSRTTGLALSIDGSRLVAVVQQPDRKGARYASALWEIPLSGGEPVRLTHSDKGESAPAFLPDGSLLFTSARPDTGSDDSDDDVALWCLPPSGEARVVARRAGGVSAPAVATATGDVVLSASRLARSTDTDDSDRRSTRKDRKINAILHDGMPIRYWDHELGEESPRLLRRAADGTVSDLAPDATIELIEASYSISADGSTVATNWRTRRPGGRLPYSVSIIDVTSGKRSPVMNTDGMQYSGPQISPDGAWIAMEEQQDGEFDRPTRTGFVIVATGEGNAVRPDLGDVTPTEWAWSADSQTLFVAGDLHSRGTIVAVTVPDGTVRSVVDDAVYSSLCVAPDGESIYALRATVAEPPRPVRVDVATGAHHQLPNPAAAPSLPGELVEVTGTAPDGAPVHGWVCLPADRSTPPPVMLWIHGGPFASWNAWSWRWNPWVAVARGWAVVLPDPAHSTGFGQRWIDRAWPYQAAEVFADCASVLDTAIDELGLDGDRVACLGGSFGGYMTNWVAGHVDRFGAIVTHAGLYALDQQHKTTDAAQYKVGLFGEPGEHEQWYADNSPHRARVGSTPMLVVHGNRDYRVPVGEALRLWWDLVSGWDGDPDTMPHRFLQFTAENHWILSPANVEIWYDAVLGFCGQHVLGTDWVPSTLL